MNKGKTPADCTLSHFLHLSSHFGDHHPSASAPPNVISPELGDPLAQFRVSGLTESNAIGSALGFRDVE